MVLLDAFDGDRGAHEPQPEDDFQEGADRHGAAQKQNGVVHGQGAQEHPQAAKEVEAHIHHGGSGTDVVFLLFQDDVGRERPEQIAGKEEDEERAAEKPR